MRARQSDFCPTSLSSDQEEISAYVTGKAPSLGVTASSQGDFSSLIDFASVKVFSSSELDHLVKNLFKVFKVLSFLDWTIRVLAKKIEDFKGLDELFMC